MDAIRQLTPNEVLFVGGETATLYQHTAGLMLLDSSKAPAFCYAAFRRHMEQRLGRIPQFRWRLHEVPMGLDLPYWVEDENFSFDHHIRRIAVPPPGNDKALSELVAYLYSRHMDRRRPLWETWFIEGLPAGRSALLQKIHHCMMDGEGAVHLVAALCDFEPYATPRELDRAITEARPGGVPEPWRLSLNAALRLSSLPMRAGRSAFGLLTQDVAKRLRQGEKTAARPSIPLVSFNGYVGSERGFVFGSLALASIKAVKDHFGCKVNDVVLALVGGSLRNYLRAQGELPPLSLRTGIAVSLHGSGDSDFSNKVTTVGVTLATDVADPVRRLRAIAEEAASAKREARGGKKGLYEMLELFPPVLVNLMVSMVRPEQATGMFGCNLIVSNIHGVDKPMYIAGARVTGMYPMSVIMNGSGMNITCMSHGDDIDFGITIDPELVPAPWSIVRGLEEALAEYVALTGKRPARRRTTPAGPRRAGLP